MKLKLWAGMPLLLLLGMLALGIVTGRALATGAPGQTPLTYGGTVADVSGKPYPGPIAVQVALFNQAVGGTAVCQSGSVQAEGGTGKFSVVLPPECADAVHAAGDLWSEMTVGPQNTVLPRVHVGAVPYALEADSASIAVTAKGLQCTGCVHVDAMVFDKNVNLDNHDLDAGTGTVTAQTLQTGAAGAHLTTEKLDLGPTAGDELTSAHVKTLTGGGNADALHTHAGLGGGGGQVIKFKGVTSVTFKGDGGLAAMNAQCAKDFGAAKMCTTEMRKELFPSPVPAVQAWILADGNWSNGYNSGTHYLFYVDGQSPHTPDYQQSSFNCGYKPNTNDWAAWFMSGDSDVNGHLNHGYTLDTQGAIVETKCDVAYPATCCGP